MWLFQNFIWIYLPISSSIQVLLGSISFFIVTLILSILTIIEDPDDEVRKAAVEALGKIGVTQAINSIIKVLDDRSEVVRNAAVKALLNIETGHLLGERLTEEAQVAPLLWIHAINRFV